MTIGSAIAARTFSSTAVIAHGAVGLIDEHDDELVATEAHDRVGGADALQHARRRRP